MVRDTVASWRGRRGLPLSLVIRDIAAGGLAHWGDVNTVPTIPLLGRFILRDADKPSGLLRFLDHIKEAFPLGKPEELAGFIGLDP